MTNKPLEEAVGRIVGNVLAGGGELYLPSIGTLYTERRAAQLLKHNQILPPRRVVQFSTQERGESLVEVLARMVREAATLRGEELPQVDAQAIYDRWLALAYTDEVLTIEKVGVLKMRHFTPHEIFAVRLNPQGAKPVAAQKTHHFDWALWIGVAAIAAAAIIGGYQFLMTQTVDPLAEENTTQPVAESAPAAIEEPALPDTLAFAAAEPTPVQSETVQPEMAPAQPSQPTASTSDDPQALQSGYRYVVAGVFRTIDNARRAAQEIAAKEPGTTCAVYRFGEKFMVSPFFSQQAEACTQFINRYAESLPGMWTYNAR